MGAHYCTQCGSARDPLAIGRPPAAVPRAKSMMSAHSGDDAPSLLHPADVAHAAAVRVFCLKYKMRLPLIYAFCKEN